MENYWLSIFESEWKTSSHACGINAKVFLWQKLLYAFFSVFLQSHTEAAKTEENYGDANGSTAISDDPTQPFQPRAASDFPAIDADTGV